MKILQHADGVDKIDFCNVNILLITVIFGNLFCMYKSLI